MVYYWILYIKYIKYCIFAMPLKVRTVSTEVAEHELKFVNAPNRFYGLLTSSGRSAVVLFYKFQICGNPQFYMKKYK